MPFYGPSSGGGNFKSGTFTRDLTTASGDVGYTGVGFQPSAIIFVGVVNTTFTMTVGVDDGTTHGTVGASSASAWTYDTGESIYAETGTGNRQTAEIKSFDSDGFTLTWTKTGSPTGTAQVFYLAFG